MRDVEPDLEPWTPTEVRTWVNRHGGNVSALARRLRVARSKLQAWMQEDGTDKRDLPPYVQSHMETIDHYEYNGGKEWLTLKSTNARRGIGMYALQKRAPLARRSAR